MKLNIHPPIPFYWLTSYEASKKSNYLDPINSDTIPSIKFTK